MLKALYYIFGILFAYHTSRNFKEIPNKIRKTIEQEKTGIKEKILIKTNSISEIPAEHKKILKDGLISFLFFIWMAIGLFTFNWMLYAGVLLYGIFTNWMIKFFKYNFEFRLLVSRIYLLLTWILCSIVIFNTYYFKIDSNQIINFFSNINP